LIDSYPDCFTFVEEYGVKTPALKFKPENGRVRKIKIEIFDAAAWSDRP
jgi:hypothetical protein